MKIAILLLSGGVVERGAELSVRSLAEIFSSSGHTVTIFQTGEVKNGESRSYKTIRIPVSIQASSHKPKSLIGKVLERMNLSKRGIATLLFSLRVAPHLTKVHFDLVIPTDGLWEILMCKALQLFKSVKIIVIGHAGIGWTDSQNLRLKPDVFVALTKPMHTWAKKIQPKTNSVMIPLPVDSQRFNTSITPATLTLKKPVVLTVAALTKYKRIDAVIRAIALLPEWSLLVIGQGEEDVNLKKLAQELIPGRFQITQVPHELIAAYYRASDVFVLASESQEAFGMVLLEAQACGLPIVTTDDESRRWIVGEQGIFVDPNNTQSFSQALEQAVRVSKPIHYQNVQRFHRASVAKEYAALFGTIKDEYAK